MPETLFRDNMTAARDGAQASFGEVRINGSPSWSWFIAAVLVFFACCGAAIAFVEVPRQTSVRGVLSPTQAFAQIETERAGAVARLNVRQGDRVAKGDVVAMVSIDRYLVDGASASEETAALLGEEIAMLRREAEAMRAEQVLAHEAQATHYELLAASLEQAEKMVQRTRKMADVRRERLTEMRALLDGGLTVKGRIDDIQSAVDQAETAVLDAEQAMRRLQVERASARMAADREAAERARALIAGERQIQQLTRELGQSRVEAKIHIVSPMDGYVSTLAVREGQTVRAGEFMLAIAPAGAPLIAEVHIPSSSIAFVEAGQAVKLQYDAFPFERFGIRSGFVAEIAGLAIPGREFGLGEQEAAMVYRATVELGEQSIDIGGRSIELQPGMELNADIVLERRKLWEWALASFAGA